MHTLTGNRDQVLKLMNNTLLKMQTTPQAGAASIGGEESDDADVLAKLNAGYMEEQAGGGSAFAASLTFEAQQNDDWYVPRNRAVAVFQSIMDEYLEKQGAPEAPAKPAGAGAASTGENELSHEEIAANVFYDGATPGDGSSSAMASALMEQFDNLDPRWASWVLVKATGWLKGKHEFISHTSLSDFQFEMKDE